MFKDFDSCRELYTYSRKKASEKITLGETKVDKGQNQF